ncbi:MAG: hypothetical protein CO182_06595, partial [Lysobacterales bacterium CG_4_9_14_3_um_filter_62_6]
MQNPSPPLTPPQPMTQRRIPRLLLLIASLGLSLADALCAAERAAADNLAWAQLAPAERAVLMPFAEQWPSLPAETRQRLRQGAARWATMSPEDRAASRQRFGQWQAMPEVEKQRLRQRYQQFQRLPTDQKRRLRQAFGRFQQLPPNQRRALRQRFEAMTPAERQAFRQNRGGAAWPGDQRPGAPMGAPAMAPAQRQQLNALV